eukprot:GAHX01003003.1.p1 GENE.GAHX01003003.1~~GAHX01003003.1.p1  ORF type:complete len:202 (+),score=16.34 GAHX01003003.1:51-656(+)
MFLISEKKYGGLGAHYSTPILSHIIYYICGIIGPYLYRAYRKRRLKSNANSNGKKGDRNTPSWFKQEIIFTFFISLSFIIYFSELLFFLNTINNIFIKVFFYQCFMALLSIIHSIRTTAVFEFVCDSYADGLEGSLYSIWSSIFYFSVLLQDTLGLLLVTMFDRFYGYEKNVGLKWESLKPASYISYIITVTCSLYGYYMK